MIGSGRAGEVDRAEQGGLDLRPEVPWADLLEEAGVEVARVVDQDVEASEPFDRRVHGRAGVGDVELDGEEVVVLAQDCRDSLGFAGGGDDDVPSRECRLGDVDAHAAAGACDEPDLLVGHVSALLSGRWVALRAFAVAMPTEPAAATRWQTLMRGVPARTPSTAGPLVK